jgi:hypothetical protein
MAQSGWVWGNIAFGGLIGLGVDFISGGAYQLYPDNLRLCSHRQLTPLRANNELPAPTLSGTCCVCEYQSPRSA